MTANGEKATWPIPRTMVPCIGFRVQGVAFRVIKTKNVRKTSQITPRPETVTGTLLEVGKACRLM